VISGGTRRQDSVQKALRIIRARKGIAIIHDGARPIVSQKVLSQGIRLCKKYGAVICGLPISDTVKYVQKNTVKKTIPRSHLYTAQTPQFFDIDLLKRSHAKIDGSHHDVRLSARERDYVHAARGFGASMVTV